MVATVGIPGSAQFRYFVGTKKECIHWMEMVFYGAESLTWRLVSNKEASKWRYQDGTKVIKF